MENDLNQINEKRSQINLNKENNLNKKIFQNTNLNNIILTEKIFKRKPQINLKNNALTLFEKIQKVPPLKIFGYPNSMNMSEIIYSKNLNLMEVNITEMKMKIIQKNLPTIELIGKRSEPKWKSVPPCLPLKLIKHPFSSNLKKISRKNTLETTTSIQGNKIPQIHQNLMYKNQFIDIKSPSKSVSSMNLPNDLKNDLDIVTRHSPNCKSNKSIKMFSSNDSMLSCIAKSKDSFDQIKKKSTNPLKDLLNELIETSNKLPEKSDCRLKLMSLINKYQTHNISGLIFN